MPSHPDRVATPIHEIKAELFKSLAHPLRVRVLELLSEGERPVSELLAETGTEASLLSQHLAVLRRSGAVTARREGSTVRYRLAHEAVAALLADARTFLLATLDQTREALEGLQDEQR